MRQVVAALLAAPLMVVAPSAYADDSPDNLRLEQLPKPVRDTVQREVKDGKIVEIDRDQDRGNTYYEVEFTRNNQRYEIHVAPEGKLLQRKTD
jgi:hypothetical protein